MGGVVDIQDDVPGVPVGEEHQVVALDLLDDHVVKEAGSERSHAIRLGVLGAGPVGEAHLGDERRAARIGDVEDVDVLGLLVIDDDDVGMLALLPGKGAVDLIGGRDGAAGIGIAGADDQRNRDERIRDVVDGEAPDLATAGVVTDLVVDDEDVALERFCLDRERLHSLAHE